jgi:hypothetical protein
MTRFFLALMFIGVLASCRSTKKIQTAISKKDTTAVKITMVDTRERDSILMVHNVWQQVKDNRINYRTFKASKVNVDYRGADEKKYDFNASVQMFKDSAIWISATAILGIEAMRVLITKDSVKLLNKNDKTYTARSITYLQEITELPLDLPTLQDLIIGNPVFLDSTISSYSAAGGQITILTIGRFFKNLLTFNASDKTVLRSKLDDAEILHSRTADLTYSDYESKKNILFSTKRGIAVAEKKRLDIKLDFRQYEFDVDVSFPFSIPKNYQRL